MNPVFWNSDNDDVTPGFHIMSLIPGGGWIHVDGEGGTRVPVVAWALREDGCIIPMVTDGEGVVGEPKGGYLDHPDVTW